MFSQDVNRGHCLSHLDVNHDLTNLASKYQLEVCHIGKAHYGVGAGAEKPENLMTEIVVTVC